MSRNFYRVSFVTHECEVKTCSNGLGEVMEFDSLMVAHESVEHLTGAPDRHPVAWVESWVESSPGAAPASLGVLVVGTAH